MHSKLLYLPMTLPESKSKRSRGPLGIASRIVFDSGWLAKKGCTHLATIRLTSTHHQRRLRMPRRRLVHAMLDGVFERGNNFFDVWWQLDSALDEWPDCDGR